MKRQTAEDTAVGGQAGDFACPDCGGHSTITVLHDDTFEYGSGDYPVTLHAVVPVHCCSQCEFEYLGREGRLIKHEAVCRHLGLLAPTEIRRIREKHSLNRASFAAVTGLSEKTLSQWENGAVIQNAAYDKYLRSLDSPKNVRRLRPQVSRSCNPKLARLLDEMDP